MIRLTFKNTAYQRPGKPLPASVTGDPTPDYWLRKANPGMAIDPRKEAVAIRPTKISSEGQRWANFTRGEVRLLNLANRSISERLVGFGIEINPSQVSNVLWGKMYVTPEQQAAFEAIISAEKKERGQVAK